MDTPAAAVLLRYTVSTVRVGQGDKIWNRLSPCPPVLSTSVHNLDSVTRIPRVYLPLQCCVLIFFTTSMFI